MSYKQEELELKTMVELYHIARELEIIGYSKLRKAELIFEIQKKSTMKELLRSTKVKRVFLIGRDNLFIHFII